MPASISTNDLDALRIVVLVEINRIIDIGQKSSHRSILISKSK